MKRERCTTVSGATLSSYSFSLPSIEKQNEKGRRQDLLLLALIGYCLHQLFDFFGIAEEIVFHQPEIVVKFKNVRHG